MENENEDVQVEEETPEQEETTQEETIAPSEEVVTLSKSDFNKLNRKAIAYEANKKNPIIRQDNPVDSVDLIKLGKKLQDYSDVELDFVTEFAKSKKPEDILKALENPFIQQGIKSQREKVEKESLTLKPSSTQSESERPKTLHERLASASIEEKEKILIEMGGYKSPRPRGERSNIGAGMRY